MSNLNPDEQYPTPQKYLEGAEVPKWYSFQSNLVTDADLKPGMIRNLEVDKRLTLPTRTHIRLLITSADVLHSWSVPRYVFSLHCLAFAFLVSESSAMQFPVVSTRFTALSKEREYSTDSALSSVVPYTHICQLL